MDEEASYELNGSIVHHPAKERLDVRKTLNEKLYFHHFFSYFEGEELTRNLYVFPLLLVLPICLLQ